MPSAIEQPGSQLRHITFEDTIHAAMMYASAQEGHYRSQALIDATYEYHMAANREFGGTTFNRTPRTFTSLQQAGERAGGVTALTARGSYPDFSNTTKNVERILESKGRRFSITELAPPPPNSPIDQTSASASRKKSCYYIVTGNPPFRSSSLLSSSLWFALYFVFIPTTSSLSNHFRKRNCAASSQFWLNARQPSYLFKEKHNFKPFPFDLSISPAPALDSMFLTSMKLQLSHIDHMFHS